MPYAWSAPLSSDHSSLTWLLDGLAVAGGMLREESDELALIALDSRTLVDMVSWESPAARAFHHRSDAAHSLAGALSHELDMLRLSVDGIRARILLAHAA